LRTFCWLALDDRQCRLAERVRNVGQLRCQADAVAGLTQNAVQLAKDRVLRVEPRSSRTGRKGFAAQKPVDHPLDACDIHAAKGTTIVLRLQIDDATGIALRVQIGDVVADHPKRGTVDLQGR